MPPLNNTTGQTTIAPEPVVDCIARLPVNKIHGIGEKTEARLHALGIRTGAEELHPELVAQADRLERRMARSELRGRTVTLKVRDEQFNTITRRRSACYTVGLPINSHPPEML